MGVTIAGSQEPVARVVLEAELDESPGGSATVVGTGHRLPPTAAALVNGTASHALDYDDANGAMYGHPTAPVLGALLPLAEATGASGDALLTAFVAGYEAECRIALGMGPASYRRGYHATGTVGALGAAAACARLLGLDAERTATALGIAATQAAGLKAMFGTMGKPFHAGKAAANGLLAARLAARGFTTGHDVVEADQGLASTLGGEFDAARGLRRLGERWYVRNNLFKYHAACYETHSTIEGLQALRREHQLRPADVQRVVVHANDLQLGMCAIPVPTTGLESKFSLRHVAALALLDADTAAIECYSDDRGDDPPTVALRERVEVVGDGPESGGTPVDVHLANGRVLRAEYDSHVPATDLEQQHDRLRKKAEQLAVPVIGAAGARAVLDGAAEVQMLSDVGELLRSSAPR
jgi:2-methylcitrate dehydratase PrpD